MPRGHDGRPAWASSSPAFSWNGGMVNHILKSDPALWDLEHVQADSQGVTYLFFYDRLGNRGLMLGVVQFLQVHICEEFSEWINK